MRFYMRIISLVLSLSIAATSPVPHLVGRSPCDFNNGEPILYHEYRNDVCPAPTPFNSDGTCPMKIGFTGAFSVKSCAGHCEVRKTFYYGQEQIFLSTPYCHGPMTCTITDTTTTAWAFQAQVPNFGKSVVEVIFAGITGGITTTVAHAQARAIKLEEGQCGYFTFLPVLYESCGTTIQAQSYIDGKCRDISVHENVCVVQASVNPNNKANPRGDTIFVKTDCSNRMPLPLDQQDPAYQHPGVALDRGVYAAFAANFVDGTVSSSTTTTSECSLGDSSPASSDCDTALSSLISAAGLGAFQGKKGGKWWAAYIKSCAIEIGYDQDWDSSCKITMTDVIGAAERIRRTCSKDGKVSGSTQLRKDGKCDSTLHISATAGRKPPQGT